MWPPRSTATRHPVKPLVSLKRRSLRASAWAGGSHVAGQVIRLAGNLVLARLLVPDAFGLMAAVSTLIMGISLLSDIGTGTVVVQSQRGTDQDFLNTAWTLQVIKGIGVWVFCTLIALAIALGQSQLWFGIGTAYNEADLPLLLAVAAFGATINGLASINMKVAVRNLDLRAVSMIDFGAQVFSLAVMVAAAVITRSVWALVIGGLVSATLKCALSHVALHGPPSRISLEPGAMKELLGKGKWVLLSSLLGFVAMNGDRLLLGGLIDSKTLGLYSIAFALASIAPAAISAILGKVIYPAFSEVLRDRPLDLGRTYRKFQRVVDAALGAIAAVMFVASDAIVGLLYDERYQDAGHFLGLLALGSIGVRFLVVEQIYVAKGRMDLLAWAILPRVILVLVGLPLGYSMYRLDGALAAIILSQFAHWPLAIWFRAKHHLNDVRNDLVLPVAMALGLVAGLGLSKVL